MALSDWLARHRAVVWLAAVFLGPVVAGLLTLARPQLHENHATLLLVLVVAMVSAAGMRPAGLVGAVTTGLAYDYFWTEPYYSFRILDTQDILTVILLVLVGGAIEQLSWWAGRQRATAARRLDYLTSLRRAAEPIAPEAHAAALQAVSDTVSTVLDADSCRLVLDEPLPATVSTTMAASLGAARSWMSTERGCPPMTSSRSRCLVRIVALATSPSSRPPILLAHGPSNARSPGCSLTLLRDPWRLRREPRRPVGRRPRARVKISQD
jgi:K+-sensing histidine kinase KdpD